MSNPYDKLFDTIRGTINNNPSGKKCPLCGSAMQLQPNGKELCSNWPGCKNAFYGADTK